MIVSFIEFSLEYKLSFSRIVCVDCTFSNSIERCNLRSWLCPQSNSETVFQTSLLGSPFSGLPSYKFGFRSSVQKNRPPGDGRHEVLVPRNDVLTNGFIGFSLARTLARILFVPLLRPPPPPPAPRNPEGVANLKKAICVVRSDSIIGVTL